MSMQYYPFVGLRLTRVLYYPHFKKAALSAVFSCNKKQYMQAHPLDTYRQDLIGMDEACMTRSRHANYLHVLGTGEFHFLHNKSNYYYFTNLAELTLTRSIPPPREAYTLYYRNGQDLESWYSKISEGEFFFDSIKYRFIAHN